jgi:hypothetical protein
MPKKTKRMKRTADTPNLLEDANILNEEILEAADNIDGESLAPEVSARTAEITVWDEPPKDDGWRVQERPMDNEVTISEQLVSEGNEQADREQRMAAGASDAAVAF